MGIFKKSLNNDTSTPIADVSQMGLNMNKILRMFSQTKQEGLMLVDETDYVTHYSTMIPSWSSDHWYIWCMMLRLTNQMKLRIDKLTGSQDNTVSCYQKNMERYDCNKEKISTHWERTHIGQYRNIKTGIEQ